MHEYRRLLKLARPHTSRLSIATSILLVGTVLNLAIPSSMGQLLETVFSRTEGTSGLNRIALIIGLILLLRMVTGFVAGYLLDWTGERIVADLRRRLFARLVRLDLRFFTETRIGELASRMTNDVSVIQTALTSSLTAVIERSLLVTGSLALMIFLNWRLTIAIFASIPLIVLATRRLGVYLYHLSRAANDRLAAANAVLEEALGAIRVVKIFVREPHEEQRFNHEIEELFRKVRSRAVIQAMYGPLVSTLFTGSLVLVLWLGGREVLAGRLTPSRMLEFLLYGSFIGTSASVFTSAYSTFKRAIGATERVFELLEQEPVIQSPRDAVSLAPLVGSIRFENVSFGYDEERPVLAGLTFSIKPGEVVALVGVSGIGKSTLMDLVPRFYDVSGGRVLVDGVDVRQADLDTLRGGIGSVPQDTILFGTTVRDNLRYGRLDSTDAEIEAAARAANAHEFIMALPQGYDSLIGERGVKLSGGQRQRISIARALLKEPAILLLDEATSSLDSESERAVQSALDDLLAARGRTTLVIAHRLSTIRNADRILVLASRDGGAATLAEEGTHHELLARRGTYHQLYTMQFERIPEIT